jgi:hypothetical protein
LHRAVVDVARDVVERDSDRHWTITITFRRRRLVNDLFRPGIKVVTDEDSLIIRRANR